MKIGYKIIIGAIALTLISKPANLLLTKYSEFKTLQNKETKLLLENFKTRPADFFKNSAYETTVKSYGEKGIKNIELDLSAKDEPLKTPIVTTDSAIDSVSLPEQASDTSTATSVAVANVGINDAAPATKPEVTKVEKKPEVPKAEPKKVTEKKVIIPEKNPNEKKVEKYDYYVQLGVFSSLDNANTLVKKAGPGFLVVKSTVNDKLYIVRSNPGDKESMDALSQSVKNKNLGLNPLVRVW